MVDNLCVKYRRIVCAAVGDGRISRGQLQVGHTVGEAAQCHGLVDIGKCLGYFLSIFPHIAGFIFHQRVYVEPVFRVIKSRLGGDGCQHLDRRNIVGKYNVVPDAGHAVVPVGVEVGDRLTAGVGVRAVVDAGGYRIAVGVNGRCVGTDDLEGGTRGTGRVGGTVQRQVCGLVAAAAHDGLHIAGGLLHEHHGCLGLRGQVNALAQHLVTQFQHVGLVLFHILVGLVCGCEQRGERTAVHTFDTLGLEVAHQHFNTVILGSAVSLLHRQGVVQADLGACRIVVRVGVFFIGNGLNGRILGRVNAQTAAVQQVVSLVVAVTQLVFQIVHDLLDGCVYKICIVRICSIFYFLVDLLDPGVHVISQRFLVLILIDISLFQHVFQHLCPALLVLLRVRDGVQAGGALGDARDTCGF